MTERKRILFILHLPPPVHGAAMVGKYIHDSRRVNEAFECRYINLTSARSLEDIGRASLGKLWHFCGLLWRIVRAVRKMKPDLVYITPNACGGAFYKDYVVVQLLKAMGCRVVAHFHNKGVSTRQDRWLDDRLYRRFFRKLKVILLAEALYKDVAKYVKREDVLICPNGIPDELKGRSPYKVMHDVPHLLFLSNLLVSKGILVLLDACQLLMEQGKRFVLDIVGGATAEISVERLEQEIRQRGLTDVARYKGQRYRAEKQECWNEANVFVFPTFYAGECFPLVLLEAMQQGVACVTTTEGGIAEIVADGQTGLLLEKTNAIDLAEKVNTLLSDFTLRTFMGAQGRARYDAMFTLNAFENNFIHTLNSVVGGVNALNMR